MCIRDRYTVTLVDEPENKFNSKAIKVLFDNVHVGYIKDGFISRIKNLLKKEDVYKRQILK